MTQANQVERMKRQLDASLQSFEAPGAGPQDASAALAAASSDEAAAPAAAGTPGPDLLRTITRAAVGTVLLAGDILARQAAIWEELASESAAGPTGGAAQPQAAPPEAAAQLVEAVEPAEPITPHDSEAVLAAVGWVISIPDQLRGSGDARRVLALASTHLSSTMAALARNSVAVASGGRLGPPSMLHDPDLQRWIALGQVEALRSRAVAQVAILSLMHEAATYLTNEPAVRQLVQDQGTTLAGDVLGEVRQYSVSGDTLVDSLVQRIFRRQPGQPSPSQEAPPTIVVPATEDRGG